MEVYTTIEYAEVGGFELVVPVGNGNFERAIDCVLHIGITDVKRLHDIECSIKIGELQ